MTTGKKPSIIELWKNALHLFTQEEVNNVLSTAWTEVAAQRYNIADSGRTTAETAIAKQQSDLEAVQKAKELKLQGIGRLNQYLKQDARQLFRLINLVTEEMMS